VRKFTIYNLQFTIFLLLFTFYILHSTFYIPSAIALESTPSATIKAKLEELKKEISSKAASLRQEIDRKLRNRAYVGILKNKSNSSLTLAALSGPKLVNINQDTIFHSKLKTKQKFSKDTLSSEDYIASLGDVDETGVLTAKKVILLPTPLASQKSYLWGQIISSSETLFTLKDKDANLVAVSPPKGAKFRLNDFIILTGILDKNKVFHSEFLYVIQQGVNLKTKKEASSGATPKSATSSSKKK